MSYCTVDDLVCRFGEHHILGLADKACKKSGDINDPDVQKLIKAKINDAVAEINAELSCCYDICQLMTMVADGYEFDILKHWVSDISHKHLQDCVRPNGTRVQVEYEDYEEEIKKICPGNGNLIAYKRDANGDILECKVVDKICHEEYFVIAGEESCLPKICKCKKECNCGQHK